MVREKANLERKLSTYETMKAEFDSYLELMGIYSPYSLLYPPSPFHKIDFYQRWERKKRTKK